MRSRQPSDEGSEVAREVAGEEEASMMEDAGSSIFYGRAICCGCCDRATELSQDAEIRFDVTVQFGSG